MATQIMVQRSRKALGQSARRYTAAEQDAATERVLSEALKASKRARRLLRSLSDV